MVLSLIKRNIDKLLLTFLILSTLIPRFGAIDNNAIRWMALSLICFTYLLKNLKLGGLKLSNKHLLFSSLMICYLLFSIFISNNSIEGIISLYKIIILIIIFFICIDIFKKISSPFFKLCVVFSISLFIEGSFTLIQFFSFSDSLTGIASNANISSSSIIIKLPLIIFLSFQPVNKREFLLLKIIEIISITSVIILGSRFGVLCLFLIYFLNILIYKKERLNQVFSILFVIAFSFYINTTDKSDRLTVDSLSIENLSNDESTNQRLNFYKKALDLSFKKPVFGYGLGSWKYESLPYNENKNRELLVPYYTHNDFLQIFFELGIIGLIFYLSFLISLFKKIIKIDNNYKSLLIIMLIVFLMNSLLNFPLHRSQEIVPFLMVAALIFFFSLKSKGQKRESRLSYSFLLGLLLPLLGLSYLEHNSLKIQGKLISDYNQGLFSLEEKELNKINYYIPNLSATGVPLSSYLSRYYFEQKDYNKSLELLKYSTKANYKDLLTQELLLKNYIFLGENNLALILAKKLLQTYTENLLYAQVYFSLIYDLNLKDELSIELLENNRKVDFHLLFFKTLEKFKDFNSITKETLIKKSLEIFPDNSKILKLHSKKRN